MDHIQKQSDCTFLVDITVCTFITIHEIVSERTNSTEREMHEQKFERGDFVYINAPSPIGKTAVSYMALLTVYVQLLLFCIALCTTLLWLGRFNILTICLQGSSITYQDLNNKAAFHAVAVTAHSFCLQTIYATKTGVLNFEENYQLSKTLGWTA